MARLFFAVILAGLILVPASAPAQVPGAMLFEQGCDAFELVEDLGSNFTPLGQEGRWLVRNLRNGEEVVYAFETIDSVPRPSEDPLKFSGTTFVAWEFEGTGIQGTNRTTYEGAVVDEFGSTTGYFEAEVIRGNRYKSGGGSGTIVGSFAPPPTLEYLQVIFVKCKAGFGG